MAEQTFERVVIADMWGRTVPGPGPMQPFAHEACYKGDRVQVTQVELDDLARRGVLEKTLAEVPKASDEPETPVSQTVTDEELASFSVEQTTAWLTQNPDQVDRLEAIENGRTKPRQGVLDAIEAIRANQG